MTGTNGTTNGTKTASTDVPTTCRDRRDKKASVRGLFVPDGCPVPAKSVPGVPMEPRERAESVIAGAQSQIALPDQLARVRYLISALQKEEQALRDILLADPTTRVGAEYLASVKEVVSYRVRGRDLKKADPDLWARLATESIASQVWITRRTDGDDV